MANRSRAAVRPTTSLEPSGENPARRRIIAAARRHFFAHGFRSVTMDDLAAEVGMSKKTLYALFPSKTALLEALLLDKFRSVESDLDQILTTYSHDVLAALQKLLSCMQRHTEEIRPSFVRDIRREAPEMFGVVQRRRRYLIERYFGKIFRDGRRAGIIRKDIAPKLAIEILLGATEAIMNPQKMAELNLAPEAGYSAIMTVILEGVMSESARVKLAQSDPQTGGQYRRRRR
jgi:AcrR family transcriptional regulator